MTLAASFAFLLFFACTGISRKRVWLFRNWGRPSRPRTRPPRFAMRIRAIRAPSEPQFPKSQTLFLEIVHPKKIKKSIAQVPVRKISESDFRKWVLISDMACRYFSLKAGPKNAQSDIAFARSLWMNFFALQCSKESYETQLCFISAFLGNC